MADVVVFPRPGELSTRTRDFPKVQRQHWRRALRALPLFVLTLFRAADLKHVPLILSRHFSEKQLQRAVHTLLAFETSNCGAPSPSDSLGMAVCAGWPIGSCQLPQLVPGQWHLKAVELPELWKEMTIRHSASS